MRSRRELLHGVIAVAAGFIAARRSFAASTTVETRDVSGFDQVVWTGPGEMSIEQTNREHLTIEAEPAVLRKIVTEVRANRLWIGFAPGNVATQLPIRFRLEVKSLNAFETRGSGDTRIGALKSNRLALLLAGSGDVRLDRLDSISLDVRIAGSGNVEVGGGRVDLQRIVVEGSGDVATPRLASREADAAIEGSGSITLAVDRRLAARIAGSGDIRYVGAPSISQRVTGSGSVAPSTPR